MNRATFEKIVRKNWTYSAEVISPESPGTASELDDSEWLTVTEAAREQGVDKARISKAANSGVLRTNGKKGRDRRIDPASLVRWNLSRADC